MATTAKNVGIKKIPRAVAVTVPKNTAPPTASWLAAPAPEDNRSGITPSPKAKEVIRIGRIRSLAASAAAAR